MARIQTRPPSIPGMQDLTLVGVGGMGAVYRGMDIDSGQLCAVKVLRPQPGQVGPTRRFRREFNAVSKLRHPGIVDVHRYGICDDGEYIVMEWVPGGDLWTVVGRHKRGPNRDARPLPKAWVAPAVSVAAQVCEALSYLHAHRILHRDLKPENILVDEKGHSRVVDFGIAKPLALDPVAPLTAHGETVGTARYMSPEQARSLELDGRSDLYSLGVILFEVLSGRPPFTAPSLFDLLMAHVTEPAPRLADLCPNLPRSLCDLVNRLLSKDRSARPADSGALREELLDHLSPEASVQAPSERRIHPRDLHLVVASALEASGRATEVLGDSGGAPNLRDGRRTPTPDPTREGVFWGRSRRRRHDPNEVDTRPDAGGAAALTPEAPVQQGDAAPSPRFPDYDTLLVSAQSPELYAPAFRGRDELIRAALAGFHAADRRPSVHWFRGGRGSGRSRLLAELRDVLRFEVGAVVLTGRAEDPKIGMSGIRPLFEPVAWYLHHMPVRDLRMALGPSAWAAVDLCPAFEEPLLRAGPISPPPADPASRRVLHYQATERLIALLSLQAPVVLLVDNAERLDPDSLDLLRYVSTPPPDAAAHRGRPRLVGAASTTPPPNWAGSAVAIPPLGTADIAITLQTALGWAVPPTKLAARAEAEQVNETPGLLLDWLAGLLREAGRASGREANEGDLLAAASGAPKAGWRARLAGLSSISLEAAALMRLAMRPASLEWLLSVSEREEEAFTEAVNALMARKVVVERAGKGLELADGEAGDVAWELMDADRIRGLGERFAEAVLADHEDHPARRDERAALAARGYLRAGRPQEAVPLLAAAVRHEQASGRPASGLAMADLWVEAARQVGGPRLDEALGQRVALAAEACEWSRADADLDELTDRAADRPERLLKVLTSRAEVCKLSQDHEGVIDAVEEAFSVALEVDAPRETLFHLSDLMAHVDMSRGALVHARDRWAQVAGEARRGANAHWEMVGWANAARADALLGEYEAARHGYEKAAGLADDQCDQLMQLTVRGDMAALLGFKGRFDRARADALAMADEATELGAVRVVGPAMVIVGELCRRLGLYEEAEAHLQRGQRVLTATEQRFTLALCQSERALTAIELGDLEAAQHLTAEATMAAGLTPGVVLESERIHHARGRVAEMRGDRAAAAAARRDTIEALDTQARLVGREGVGRWSAVNRRLDVITWAGWEPTRRRS